VEVIIPDANLLIYATNVASPLHQHAHAWWRSALAGDELVGIPWASLVTFLRLSTGPSVYQRPLAMGTAVSVVESWLDSPNVSMINPGKRHVHALRVFTPEDSGGSIINDVHLAALAWEHGGTVYSADRDFSRIPQVHWINPFAGM
jgi:toxin-antitoxin system PIN domain toxin